jgi:hypothetical protein
MPLLGRYRMALWSLFFGLASALVVHYFWGDLGYFAMQVQAEEIKVNRQNYEHLEHLHDILRQTKKDKEGHDERLILEARKVGFYRRDEQRIIIPHFELSEPPLEVGTIVPYKPIMVGSRGYGLFALVVGICLATIWQLMEGSSRPEE